MHITKLILLLQINKNFILLLRVTRTIKTAKDS